MDHNDLLLKLFGVSGAPERGSLAQSKVTVKVICIFTFISSPEQKAQVS